MTSVGNPDWDALAPHWHIFETAGNTRSVLSSALVHLRPPVLYVGGGRGVYPAKLNRWFAGCENVVADVCALPVPDGSVASVFCSTGVVEYMDAPARLSALAEMLRTVRPGGAIMLAVFIAEGQRGMSAGPLAPDAFAAGDDRAGTAPRASTWLAFDRLASQLGDRQAAHDSSKAPCRRNPDTSTSA